MTAKIRDGIVVTDDYPDDAGDEDEAEEAGDDETRDGDSQLEARAAGSS